MVEEEYCKLDTAIMLRDKGFPMDESCTKILGWKYNIPIAKAINDEYWSTITHQRARRWLRKNKGYQITILLDGFTKVTNSHSGYYILIQQIGTDFEIVSPVLDDPDKVFFEEYEDAEEEAIRYVLSKLLKDE